MSYHKVIVIDLGTTYSAVSLWDYVEQKVVVVKDRNTGLSKIPSVVSLDPQGRVIVGAQAQSNLVVDPANTLIEVKRWMGAYEREPDVFRNDMGEPKRLRFREREYLPQEIAAFILMELKRMAEEFVGEPIHDAVITVPAYFREPQKGATADAAAIARLNARMLLNEPTAAAVSFGMDQIKDDQQHIYAVYDLGGGTFDVSIISVTKEEVSVVGTGGDPKLGGGDFDDRITGYVVDYIREKNRVDLSREPNYTSLWSRIKREAELRKRELSTTTSTMLSLPYLTGQLSVNVPLSRSTFEGLIGDLLQKSLDCLDQAIDSADQSNSISRDMIEQVLLVGGSTRVACIRPMLAEHMGMELQDVRNDFDPDEVVSRGAAIVAMRFHPKDAFEGEEVEIDMSTVEGQAEAELATTQAATIVLNDVTSHSLGIMINGSDFFPMIPKDSTIPVRRAQGGFTNSGHARTMELMIFQGESPNALDNTLIGKLVIPLPEERERGYYQFEVTFALDINGLLNVSALCLNDKSLWDTKVQCNVRASRDEIDKSARYLQDVMAGKAEEAAADPQTFQLGSVPPLPPRPVLPVPPLPRPAAYAAPPPPTAQSRESRADSQESLRQQEMAVQAEGDIQELIVTYRNLVDEIQRHPIDSPGSLEEYAARFRRLGHTVEKLRSSDLDRGRSELDDLQGAIERNLKELDEIKLRIRANEAINTINESIEEYTAFVKGYQQHPLRSVQELKSARDKLLQLRANIQNVPTMYLDEQGREVVTQLEQTIARILKQIDPYTSLEITARPKPQPRPEVPGAVDKVHFSITAPPLVQAGSSFVVDLWAHLEQQRQEVIQRAVQAVGGREILVKSKGPLPVARGTVLAVNLKIEGLRIEDAEETIQWEGEIGSASFAVQVPQDAAPGVRLGRAAIYANAVQIARLNFELQVGAQLVEAKSLPRRRSTTAPPLLRTPALTGRLCCAACRVWKKQLRG